MAAPERLAEVSQTRAGWFWPLIYTLALHAILFALLFVSFALAPQIPAAQPIIQATVYQLKAERPKSAPVPDKITAEAEKTKAVERETEQLEQQKRQREAEQQRKAQQAREAEQAKAAETKRQAEAAKAAEALKQAEEKARQVAEQAQKQAAEAKRLEAEQKQREADAAKKRAAEQARQKAEAEAAAKAAAEAKRKAEEATRQKREAEAKRQREAEQAKRRAEEERKAKARAELLAAEAERRKAQSEMESKQLIGSLGDLITGLVIQHWRRPPSARNGMEVELLVSMLPDGTITRVTLIRSSGDTAYDNSTMVAVRSIGRVPEIQQLRPVDFDTQFREKKYIFRPEDLER